MSTRISSVDSISCAEAVRSRPAGLPVMRDPTLAYVLSLIVALIMSLVSVVGLLYPLAFFVRGAAAPYARKERQ